MLSIEDETILSSFEKDELENPSPRKIDGDRIIYKSRELRTPKTHGRPVLCDFGEARMGSTVYHEDIQPYLYRAPEVLLRMKWDNKVDIWNVGVMVSSRSGVRASFANRSIRSGISSKTSICSTLKTITRKIQTCITWLKWSLSLARRQKAF